MGDPEVVAGKRSLIRFEGRRCIHSRACVLGRPDVFVPNVEGEWIHPDQASPAELAALALACPSGAIVHEPLDGSPPEAAPVVNVLRVRENGPLALHGELVVGDQPAGFRATLCRCGASSHKPYCDGSHSAAGFSASGEPPTVDSPALAVRNGPLRISPQKDGPLRVQGNLEIVSGTGRTVKRVTEAWLCRCGQSSRKPFCDNTHRKVGFQAE